uniref:Uncharacterized protein n=1 Tax=Leptobrachium leishanense TaxID=445787 RepID=A0A8C5QHQ6_9ANUR
MCKKLPVMASVDLRPELTCSICLNIFTDPVTVPCGHSFCRTCIGNVMDTQGMGEYSCPECKEMFRIKPALKRNQSLSNITESFQSAEKRIAIPCANCILSPVPAVITCLHCEASLCEYHLSAHSKSAEHVLTEPTTSLENRKCSVHKKVLEYYCCEDAACICVSCRLDGEHRGHQVETLNEASEKKKERLRNILQKLTSQREEAEERVQNLEVVKRQVRGKTAGVTERFTPLIRDIGEQLEDLKKQVLGEISRQTAQVSLPISDLIRQLEIKKEELSRKMGDIEELCDMTNPLTVLQEQESDRADYCNAEEDTERHHIEAHDVEDLDVGLIAETLHSGLARIVTKVTRQPCVPEASDMLLDVNTASDMLMDVNTASDDVSVSEDLKTVSRSKIVQRRPKRPERFLFNQVLSTSSFSTGRHYWELEVSDFGWWQVGMTYPSIKRNGGQSWIGDNNKSWCLSRFPNKYSVKHDRKEIPLPLSPSCHRFGIFLDYEAGRLSFYELCDPIRRLHTFTATFTEPLHAVFWVYGENTWVRV